MRDARFVGLAANGDALIVEHDGEHLRLPLDGRVRAALAGDPQMPMPLETHVTPRQVQHRIRCGESAADIAASSGVAIELIARFEGPVLDERRWHAEQARRAVVDGTPLAERLAAVTYAADAGDEAMWDARLAEDGGWRVTAMLPDGRTTEWSWDPRTHRLRGRDDLARLAVSGDIARDDLEAVLRPIAAARRAQQLGPVAEVDADPPVVVEPEAAAVELPTPDVAEVDAVVDSPVALRPDDAGEDGGSRRPGPRKRRAPVPSWEEIIGAAPRAPRRDTN